RVVCRVRCRATCRATVARLVPVLSGTLRSALRGDPLTVGLALLLRLVAEVLLLAPQQRVEHVAVFDRLPELFPNERGNLLPLLRTPAEPFNLRVRDKPARLGAGAVADALDQQEASPAVVLRRLDARVVRQVRVQSSPLHKAPSRVASVPLFSVPAPVSSRARSGSGQVCR